VTSDLNTQNTLLNQRTRLEHPASLAGAAAVLNNPNVANARAYNYARAARATRSPGRATAAGSDIGSATGAGNNIGGALAGGLASLARALP